MKVAIPVRIPVNEMEALKEEAWRNRASTSEYLRKLINECEQTHVDLMPRQPEMTRTTAMMGLEEKAWLQSKAAELNTSVDELVRTIIRKAIAGELHKTAA